MRANEMTETQRTAALARYERAEAIIADYESQHRYTLPTPWRETITVLLLNGLGDTELHRIFETILHVEFEAGRLDDRPTDYSVFKDD
jgi:hypothetical protein